ncbi:hypothetical protein [Azohydromonas sediminis]|uniref:hypothetical protein n=1 Tax=Azohydromonas sediminis TaxID=2259674 RepID=UPI0013C36D91|nr:hypothetical protein [Azohydromonas sediminis]
MNGPTALRRLSVERLRLLARRTVRRGRARIIQPNVFPPCDGASAVADVHVHDLA